MAFIVVPPKQRVRPTGFLRPRWDLLPGGAVSAFLAPSVAGTLRDVRTGVLYAPGSSLATTNDVGGFGYQFGSSPSNYVQLAADADNLLSTTTCTVLLLRSLNNTSYAAYAQHGYSSGATDRVLIHNPFTDGTIYWDYGNATSGSGGGRISAAGQTFIPGTIDAFAFVAGPNRGREIWRNGVRLAANSTSTFTRNTTASAFFVGSADGLQADNNETVYQYILLADQLPEGAIRAWSDDPWRTLFFRDVARSFYFSPTRGGAGGVTGTLAATDGADLAAFTGTHTPPTVTGTLAATEAADAAVFSGSEVFSGTLAATDGADSAAFAGTEVFSGTLAATDGADSAAFSGTHTLTAVTGTLAATDGADAAAFSGLHTITVTGTLAATDGADAAAFSGTVANPVTGTLAATDGADAAAFSGTVTAATTGTLAATDGADEAAFAGTVANPVTGTLAATEGADTAAFSGTQTGVVGGSSPNMGGGGGGGAGFSKWFKESGIADSIDEAAREIGKPRAARKPAKQAEPKEIAEEVAEEVAEAVAAVTREDFERLEARIELMEARILKQLKRNEEEYYLWRAMLEDGI